MKEMRLGEIIFDIAIVVFMFCVAMTSGSINKDISNLEERMSVVEVQIQEVNSIYEILSEEVIYSDKENLKRFIITMEALDHQKNLLEEKIKTLENNK